MNDFIGVYENMLSFDDCLRCINYFEHMRSMGFVINRKQSESARGLNKKDESLFGLGSDAIVHESRVNANRDVVNVLHKAVWDSYALYAEQYDVLNDIKSHSIWSYRIQKTEVGGGYHVWHCENNDRDQCTRVLVYTVYLNDVREGGETEFLYQHRRVPARAGTVVLFPAAFTHVHRGNPPISNVKYISTGWIEY